MRSTWRRTWVSFSFVLNKFRWFERIYYPWKDSTKPWDSLVCTQTKKCKGCLDSFRVVVVVLKAWTRKQGGLLNYSLFRFHYNCIISYVFVRYLWIYCSQWWFIYFLLDLEMYKQHSGPGLYDFGLTIIICMAQ